MYQSRHREVLGTMREFEAKVSIPETTYGLKGQGQESHHKLEDESRRGHL